MNFHQLHTFVLNSFGFFVCWRHCVLCSLHLVTFLKFLPDWIRGYIKSSLTFFWTINWSFPKAFQTLQCPLVLNSGICLPSCRSRSEEEMKRLRETYPSQPNMQARWLENIMISFLDSIAALWEHYDRSISCFQGGGPDAHLLPARPAAPLAQIHKTLDRPPPLWQVGRTVGRKIYLTFWIYRLVSAFRDKLERFNSYYYTNYGRKIVTRFRKRAQAEFGSDFFSEK